MARSDPTWAKPHQIQIHFWSIVAKGQCKACSLTGNQYSATSLATSVGNDKELFFLQKMSLTVWSGIKIGPWERHQNCLQNPPYSHRIWCHFQSAQINGFYLQGLQTVNQLLLFYLLLFELALYCHANRSKTTATDQQLPEGLLDERQQWLWRHWRPLEAVKYLTEGCYPEAGLLPVTLRQGFIF